MRSLSQAGMFAVLLVVGLLAASLAWMVLSAGLAVLRAVLVGLAFWFVGHVGWAYDELVRRDLSWLRWHTIFSLCGGIAPLIALYEEEQFSAHSDVSRRRLIRQRLAELRT